MLQLTIPAEPERWDPVKSEFVSRSGQTLILEHSLVSLSKWESKWEKAFFSRKAKTEEETLDYVKCMTITQNVDPNVYEFLTTKNIQEINKYIEAPMTATSFSEDKVGGGPNRDQITSELIYYWMIAHTIPFECQKWHLNRLLTLIRVCNIKNQPPKKRSSREIAKRHSALNAARRQQLNTKG